MDCLFVYFGTFPLGLVRTDPGTPRNWLVGQAIVLAVLRSCWVKRPKAGT